MFDTWIHIVEFREVVEGRISISIDERFEHIFNLNDVYKIPILIERISLKKNLHFEVVRMPFIFRATIRHGEIVLRNKRASDAKRIHKRSGSYA